MAIWKLSPQHKKSAVEKMFFYNGSKAIIVEQGWRWGTFTVESDERPLTDLELVNEDGYELGCIDNNESWELYEMTDGCWLDIDALRDATEEDVTAFEQAWEEDGYDGVEELGWSNDDTEYYYYGPLELINEDTGQVFLGDAVETQEQTEQQLLAELDQLVASMPDPDEPAVTDWFDATTTCPDKIGIYQIGSQFTNNTSSNWPFPYYTNWDGKKWNVQDIVNWRGLANKPK